MDCVDCHNRPSHPFSPSPEKALDSAIARGELQRNLSFVRREALAALRENYADRQTAEQQIAARLLEFYESAGPVDAGRRAEIDRAIAAVQRIYARNVFPKMKVTWNSHPNNAGHRDDAPGCFRCHDDQHRSKDGKVIRQDCDLCHTFE